MKLSELMKDYTPSESYEGWVITYLQSTLRRMVRLQQKKAIT